MALRRLLSQVKRHEMQLRELSYLAAQPYRTSQLAREGGVLSLSSSVKMRAFSRSNYSGKQARGLCGIEGSISASLYLRELNLLNDPVAVIRLFEMTPMLHNDPSALSEYAKARAKVDKLDQSERSKKLHRGKHLKEKLSRTLCALSLDYPWISAIKALIVGRGEDIQPSIESNTRFSDVKGLDEAKAKLENVVQYLRNPQHFSHSGGASPEGVLIVGPPGTGKTMLARAIAGEACVPFFSCSGSELKELSVYAGVQRVRNIIDAANSSRSPCIIFIDEIDTIGLTCNPNHLDEITLTQLIKELLRLDRKAGNIIIAATKLPEYRGLVHPGLFDHLIELPYPDIETRMQMLEAHMSKVLKAEKVDLRIIARGTLGFSYTDLANLVDIAAIKAEMDGSLTVSMAELERAKDKIIMGCEYKSAYNRSGLKNTAYHEAGHALLTIYSDASLPLYEITIVPNGNVLGSVSHLKLIEERDVAREVVLARIEVYMGGKVAEELIFGESNPNGSVSDLEKATNLATGLVTLSLWKKVVAKLNYYVNGKSADEEVKELLERASENAKIVLTMHIEELHVLANALLEHENLSSSQVMDVLAKMKTDEQQIVVESSSQLKQVV